jgi:hypothetical protein
MKRHAYQKAVSDNARIIGHEAGYAVPPSDVCDQIRGEVSSKQSG